MRAIGIRVYINLPHIAAVVAELEGSWAAPVLRSSFELGGNSDDLATQLSDLARSFRSYLSGANADQVVVRKADYQKQAGNKDGPRVRLLAEGAMAAAARDEVETVLVKSGKECAELSPAVNKDDLDSEAKKLSSKGSANLVQAIAAALAVLPPT
jgi:hypothetical protein